MDGYANLDAKNGDTIFPLAVDASSVDEIRASHVLEHFPHGQTQAVLADWTDKLRPGGLLKIAVPDFPAIAQNYLARKVEPTQGYIMGGQVDGDDYHKAIFDYDTLSVLMRQTGLVAINYWHSEIEDCASLPISLNLCGWKRPERWPKTCALMSVPRLGFMDNFFCNFEALGRLGIPLKKMTGAFWGQCLERGMEESIRDLDPEYLLTIDYDTVYSRQDVEDLLALMIAHPEVDALAPIQSARSKTSPLFVVRGEDGQNLRQVPAGYFDGACVKVQTAHFGCTLIRTSALKDMPKPWFHSRPDADGGWHEGHVDDDIYFWLRFAEAGKQLRLASRVSVGHMELMIRWPDDSMQAHYQHHSDYAAEGKPEGTWQ